MNRSWPDFFKPVAAIIWKDLVAELRSKEMFSAMLVFALIEVIVLNFAVELRASLAKEAAIGFLWVTIIFSGMLGLNRSLSREKDRGCLDGLLLCPASRGAIYTGKMAGNLLFILAADAVIIPVFVVLFNVPFLKPLLLLTVLLGTIGFAGIGTLLSAMAVHTRAREVLLPIILLPVSIPLILASVRASRIIIEGRGLADFWPWIGLLVTFDVLLLVLSFLTFDFIVEE